MKHTIFTLESRLTTWFIDYNSKHLNPYKVSKNDKYKRSFTTYGEALEYVFNNQKGVDFYTQVYVDKLKERIN